MQMHMYSYPTKGTLKLIPEGGFPLFYITYLNHSGFLAETDSHILLFDYFPDCASIDGTLSDGIFHPKTSSGKQLAVFISHSHHDHFTPAVFDWAKIYPDTLYFVGKDIRRIPDGVRVFRMRGDDMVNADGFCVSALRSTDAGVAFIVKTDGLLLYHAGDLNDWRWEGEPESDNARMSTAYQKEMQKLSGIRFDAAFVPVDPRQGANMLNGLAGFLKAAHATHVFPMHFWGDYTACSKAANDPALSKTDTIIHQITRKGECFDLSVPVDGLHHKRSEEG